jgi:hypothetical protein
MKKKTTTVRNSKSRKKLPAAKPAAVVLREKGEQALAALRSAYNYLLAVIRPFRVPSRRLRSLETLSLPNKQTISLVRVDGQEFLVGGTASSIVLLAKFEPPAPSAPRRKSHCKPVVVGGALMTTAETEQLAASLATKVQ